MYRRLRARLLPLAWAACLAGGALAQTAPDHPELRQAFDAAWQRQPEAAAQAERLAAADAARRSAAHWSAGPAALELRGQTDRLNGTQGAQEFEAALVVPLWLPGERHQSGRLAEAEQTAAAARIGAAQLRLAARLREAWWHSQRAALDLTLARDRLDATRQLAADVARRVQAGDLAPADQTQAEAALAQAEAAQAEAVATALSARLQLRSLTGLTAAEPSAAGAEPDPAPAIAQSAAQISPDHPALRELRTRAAAGRQAAELAALQQRANPELSLGSTRSRSQSGEPYQGSLTLALRLPLDGGSRSDARNASARADAIEAERLADLEQERLQAELAGAQARAEAARLQLDATERRARLATDLRRFHHRAFQLGESDLPTRLRVELEATEAQRQAARARLDLAASVSALRQALGLLPE